MNKSGTRNIRWSGSQRPRVSSRSASSRLGRGSPSRPRAWGSSSRSRPCMTGCTPMSAAKATRWAATPAPAGRTRCWCISWTSARPMPSSTGSLAGCRCGLAPVPRTVPDERDDRRRRARPAPRRCIRPRPRDPVPERSPDARRRGRLRCGEAAGPPASRLALVKRRLPPSTLHRSSHGLSCAGRTANGSALPPS